MVFGAVIGSCFSMVWICVDVYYELEAFPWKLEPFGCVLMLISSVTVCPSRYKAKQGLEYHMTHSHQMNKSDLPNPAPLAPTIASLPSSVLAVDDSNSKSSSIADSLPLAPVPGAPRPKRSNPVSI